MSFHAIKQQSKKETRTEVFPDIKLPNLLGTHKIKAKIETGAEGKHLPPFGLVMSKDVFQK